MKQFLFFFRKLREKLLFVLKKAHKYIARQLDVNLLTYNRVTQKNLTSSQIGIQTLH